jgi:hypothetical protein
MSHGEGALSDYKLSSAVLGIPKQENLQICKWEPKKRNLTG